MSAARRHARASLPGWAARTPLLTLAQRDELAVQRERDIREWEQTHRWLAQNPVSEHGVPTRISPTMAQWVAEALDQLDRAIDHATALLEADAQQRGWLDPEDEHPTDRP